MKIILEEPSKKLKYYAGFASRAAQPIFTVHNWAAVVFESAEEAQHCLRQLNLLEYQGLRIVD